ncbi:UTP--glucose-1-phosphate uridylyltransferase [Alkalihalobacillus sp. MEB130]|uniref:UTP--glucose-1-phosphate uridylyltransferase n=1 Tax=Alkalihalobacillus sp. MEB130 TaxID=2976704 RepID=UPI0028E02F71|nr:UTP--glucose-1-phosphate uridylyltransferase [Alkalihalobacillus sp. MEB130]MDT8860604.1 UTP--glucose-1-phosphate uridylyltransferase [Alkalihalobacillus sp. MEB130]
MKVRKAIIPAAGYGTRSLPITKVVPKEMFPINGRPAIDYIIEEAISSGIEEILIIVSRNKNMIMDYFDRSLELETFLERNNKQHLIKSITVPDIHIQFVRQPTAKGLGDAIRLGKPFVNDEPFAVMLPDDLFLDEQPVIGQLITAYQEVQSNVIGVQQVPENQLKNYGVIKEMHLKDQLFEVLDLIEKPQSAPPSDLAVTGRYVLDPTIFTFLEQLKPGSGGEIQLTDALKDMLQLKKCFAQNLSGTRYDIGNPDDYYNLLLYMYKKFGHDSP